MHLDNYTPIVYTIYHHTDTKEPAMTARLSERQTVDIITAFTVELESMQSIANRHNRTRQGIWKLLKRNGINPDEYGKITVSCTACGAPVVRSRSHVRHRKHLFCGLECYSGYIEAMQNGSYSQNRQGQRVGRAIVSRYFALQPGNIVHHEDRNTMNNRPKNLKVFANQGDHIRYHRWTKDGIDVKPLWDGSSL